MWPFSSSKSAALPARKLDDQFSVAGQLRVDQLPLVVEAGDKTIVCARPDNEESGQPAFRDIAAAAKALGLLAVHIPISAGLGETQVKAMKKALHDLPGPYYGYCRSGARAGSLYASAKRG